MSMDTLLDAAPATRLLRPKGLNRAQATRTISAPSASAPSYKRMPATELLKALLGIRDRQKKTMTERVTIRMSVMNPQGRPAISLWLNGRDALT